jgi:hypothetical protein
MVVASDSVGAIMCASARASGTRRERGGLVENDGMGWKMFAGILILIGGTMNVFDGLVGITQTSYIARYTGGQLPITNSVKTWSWVVLIIGAIMVLAGFLIFAGNMFGRVVGIIVASVNALAQLAYLNHNTFWSFTMIIIDLLVIYGLAAHGGRIDEWSSDAM